MHIRPFAEPDRVQVAALWKAVFDYREPRNDPHLAMRFDFTKRADTGWKNASALAR